MLGEDEWGGSSLWQTFTIDAGSASLYFDYLTGFETGGEESFTASLLDPTSPYPPLVGSPYYFMHDWDDLAGVDQQLYDPTYVTVTALTGGWSRVSLDLGWLSGAQTDALLAFDFVPGLTDTWDAYGQVSLDNVTLVPVPVPAAVVLALTGFGTALWQLRRRS